MDTPKIRAQSNPLKRYQNWAGHEMSPSKQIDTVVFRHQGISLKSCLKAFNVRLSLKLMFRSTWLVSHNWKRFRLPDAAVFRRTFGDDFTPFINRVPLRCDCVIIWMKIATRLETIKSFYNHLLTKYYKTKYFFQEQLGLYSWKFAQVYIT